MCRWLLVGMALMASLATAQEAVDWSSLVEKVMPAVVTIFSADEKDIVQGSGFIISPSPTLSLEERFEQACQEALQFAQKIKDASARSLALSFIAKAMAEAWQTEQANKTFQLALQAAQKIEGAGARSEALKDIAEAMAKVGQTERANETFQLALQVAQKIEDASDRSSALRGIAEAMAEAGQIDRAVKVAETMDDPVERLQALAAIIAAKREAGKREAGKR